MDQELGGLGAAFPEVSVETWHKVVGKALGGADPESALGAETDNGFRLRPLYTRADWATGRSGVPGAAPFTRGASADGGGRWDIRAVIDEPRLAEARGLAETEIAGGAGSLALRLAGPGVQGGPWGLRLSGLDDLDQVLTGVDLNHTPIALDAGAQGFAAAAALVALWARRAVTPEKARGALNLDPIGAGSGDFATFAGFIRAIEARYPQVTAAAVDARPYHAAGASEAQEIAFALATGAAYLRVLEDAGLPLERALAQIRFIFATDSRFFLSIAKLRAARLAWSRLLEACGVDPAAGPMRIWAETAWQELARRDPYVNMLRGSAACFAAALGDAEAVSVRPFDEALTVPSAFARRIARNTQLVLAEEAGLARVLDPAGGSWFIESATEALATAAWTLFQEIEAEGGMTDALANGRVARMIADVADRRAGRLATRAQPLTGVSIFPDLAEPMVSRAEIDWAALDTAAVARGAGARKEGADAALAALTAMAPDDRLGGAVAALEKGAGLAEVVGALPRSTMPAALQPARLAAPFEALRDACDALPLRPKVFLANWGRARDYLEPATFARNLFAVAGIEAVGESSFEDTDALLAAAQDSGAKLIVLCTSAEKRARDGATLIAALKKTAPLRLYAVGGEDDALTKAGADEALADGVDVIALLSSALRLLGAKVQ